jgi:hypothetical protein
MKQATQPVRGRGTVLTAVAIAVAAVASLVLAPLASAASNPVATGSTTTITLNSGFVKKLKKSKVKLTGISPATVKGKTVTLPIEEGSLEVNGQGTLTHAGGLKFKAGKKTATLKALVLDTTKSSLSGKLGGKSLKIASVSGVTATRAGFGTTVTVAAMKLTGKAATELNKKLGFTGKKKKGKRASTSKSTPKPFKGNQVLGGASSVTQPKTLGVLPTGKATLVADLGTLAKFGGLGITPAPIAPAEIVSLTPPTFAFPLAAEGTISPLANAGTTKSSGGIKLAQEKIPGTLTITLTLTNIWVDLATQKATAEVTIESSNPGIAKAPGNLGRASIANLAINPGATVTSNPTAHTVTVSNATATLQGVTAETLNATFAPEEPPASGKHKEVFKEGDVLGTFSFTAQTE